MPVPRNRLSNARKNSKRAHHAKVPKNTPGCVNCSKPKLPHRICGFCGHYNGKAIVQKDAK